MRLVRARGSAELEQVASGSATQAVPLAWGQKNWISGNRRRPKPITWEWNSWGSLKRRNMRKKSQQQSEEESIQI